MTTWFLTAGLAFLAAFECGCGPSARPNQPAPGPTAKAAVPGIPSVIAGTLDPALKQVLDAARAGLVGDPGSAEAWGRFGQALDAAEFAPEARDCYRQAVRLDPGSPRWLHLLALLELQSDADSALAHLTRAAESSGASNDAPRLRLVQALIERGQAAAATPHLVGLLQANPDHPAARLELARVRFAEQRLDEAAGLLEPCATNPYTARPAILLLSQVRARQGRAEEGSALARRAAAMPKPFDWPDPYLREVQNLRADRARQSERVNALLAQRKFAEAESLLGELLQRLPDEPELLLLSGRSRLLQRKCAEAETQFRAHLRLATNSLNGLVQLGLSLLCQQRWKDGAEVFERAVAIKPDFAQVHLNLALARSRMGDGAGAISSYREALRSNPGDAAAHASLAEELLRNGAIKEARAEAGRALELDPNHAKARAIALQVEKVEGP